MANLKETRGRIKSIKSTQKITKAMKMVATAKLKKVRDLLASLREYTTEIDHLISTTLTEISEDDAKIVSSHPLLRKASNHESTHLIVFNTSNRGLCGGINNYNIKYLKQRVEMLTARGRKIAIYAIGKKGFDYCSSHYPEYLLNKAPIVVDEKIRKEVEEIKLEISNAITDGKIATSSIIYTQFVSTTSQSTKEIPLTPIHASKNTEKVVVDYNFDTPKLELIARLIPEFMLCKILSTIFENITSEQSARMIAMENASNNAAKAVQNLTLIYNRIRQSNITREISEIVSGVESFKQV